MENTTDKILAAYEEMATSYNEKIEHKPHNAYYDRPNTLALMPDVRGKAILDAACGPGKYAEILLGQGAQVTGFDISPSMVAYARERNPEAGTFFVHNLAQPLTMLADGSFDLVLCALAMHYIADWAPTIQEFYRVLKPGGQLILSIEHPFTEYNFHKSTDYFAVESVHCTWKGFGKPVEVYNYRRPLEACIAPLTENGFYIEKLVEPKPTAEFEQYDPRHYAELNAFPGFMCLRAVRKE